MKLKIVFILLLFVSFEINADTLGVRLIGGSWSTEFTGYVRDSSNELDTINLQDDLKLKDTSQSFAYLYVEHPIPLIPNIRIGQSSLNSTGVGTVSAAVTFNGVVLTATESVTSTLNLDHSELTLFWSLLDNYIGLDVGVNVKNFDGKVTLVGSTSGTVSSNLKATVPMIYAALDLELPLTGLSLGINGSFLGVGKASLTDVMTFIRYETAFSLGIEGGYRTFQFNFDESPVKTEIKAAGAYISAFLHF